MVVCASFYITALECDIPVPVVCPIFLVFMFSQSNDFLTSERSEEVLFLRRVRIEREHGGVPSVRRVSLKQLAEGIVVGRRNSDRRCVFASRR